MPKEITHVHISGLVAARCSPAAAALLADHPRVYEWGSVSPDLFYYDLHLPHIEERSPVPWGEIIHGREGEDTTAHVLLLLQEARELLRTSPEIAGMLFAFVAGYLTHFAADTVFHPYVYSLSGNYYASDPHERKAAEGRHRLFETGLDLHILKRRRETIRQFGLTRRLTMTGAEQTRILHAFADALRQAHAQQLDRAFMRRITRRAYRRSLKIIASFQWEIPVRLLIVLNRLAGKRLRSLASAGYGPHPELRGIDYANPGEAPHPITGEILDGSLDNLLQRSTERGASWVEAAFRWFVSAGDGKKAEDAFRRTVRPLSLNNGMEKMPTRAMQYSKILDAFRT